MANFPKRPNRSHLKIKFPHTLEININDSDVVRSAKIFRTFSDEKKYIEWKKNQERRSEYYCKEINLIREKIKKPSSQFSDQYLWRRIIDITIELEWWYLINEFEKDIIITMRMLALRCPSKNQRI